jgi:GntR family transcriptional regulator, transcriptional repressor for pyruvate dehydrogenase complex
MSKTKEQTSTLSLKETCLVKIESMIFSGELSAGQKLLPEREFAELLSVSRPVLHEALVELSMKGMVTISPRHGVVVNDFRTNGSLLLLDSLVTLNDQRVNKDLWRNLFDFRRLIEGETACLAARNRTPDQIDNLKAILHEESLTAPATPEKLTSLDFSFHLLIARISGNLVYPLLINSFQSAYTSYTHAFFARNINTPIIVEVFQFHAQLIESIEHQESESARKIMTAMLIHGEKYWRG